MFTRATPGFPLLPAQILTEVEHRWDEAPPDDELSALEQLLEPLLGLFAQFSHVFQSRTTTEPVLLPRTRREEVTQLTWPDVEVVPLPRTAIVWPYRVTASPSPQSGGVLLSI